MGSRGGMDGGGGMGGRVGMGDRVNMGSRVGQGVVRGCTSAGSGDGVDMGSGGGGGDCTKEERQINKLFFREEESILLQSLKRSTLKKIKFRSPAKGNKYKRSI